MAKHQLSKDGWINFTGLRFAMKFATREEIIQATRDFFSRRGLHFGELKMEFRRTRKPKCWVDGQKSFRMGGMDENPFRVRVYVELHKSWGGFFETLFHELDHAAWQLEGKPFDCTLPYSERAHEIRALEVGFVEALSALFTPKRTRKGL